MKIKNGSKAYFSGIHSFIERTTLKDIPATIVNRVFRGKRMKLWKYAKQDDLVYIQRMLNVNEMLWK